MSYRPKCPNHTCEMNPTNVPTIWICPISDFRFAVDVDHTKAAEKIDIYERKIPQFIIKPLDGEEE